MAAGKTLSQLAQSHNSVPRHGVITLFGYGIRVNVDRGHLVLDDGIGSNRHSFRLPRVGHGLKRLVIVGSDGYVSLSAIRWLASQDAALSVLDRDGTVLATTGPVRPSDARLRRAQVMALHNGIALQITRELITRKLAGQEQVARKKLLDSGTADTIREFRDAATKAETIDAIRYLESQGASAYWAAWRNLSITFPKADLPRVPDHWRRFDTRKSPLSGSQRLAADPANAMLNYLYAVLESETRLAVAALGLDPGLGFWHVDTPARDSLACDLMELIRPQVDAFLLDWITREPLKRSWFFEQRDGNCRLMSPLAIELSQTARMWGQAVAPFAEWVARTLWSNSRKPSGQVAPPTRLTQHHKREAKEAPSFPRSARAPRLHRLCRGCGKSIRPERTHCGRCAIDGAKQRLIDAARLGRQAARNPEARAKHGASRRRQAEACSEWDASTQPVWLTAEVYTQKIQPLLAALSTSAIGSHIAVSRGYAGRIRDGYRPHPRHWRELAELVGFEPSTAVGVFPLPGRKPNLEADDRSD
jgi:CRISPR-associated endonuclease Cas1